MIQVMGLRRCALSNLDYVQGSRSRVCLALAAIQMSSSTNLDCTMLLQQSRCCEGDGPRLHYAPAALDVPESSDCTHALWVTMAPASISVAIHIPSMVLRCSGVYDALGHLLHSLFDGRIYLTSCFRYGALIAF